MPTTTRLLLTLILAITTANAFLDCYPSKDCKTAAGQDKIAITEKHQGSGGSFTFFSDVKCECERDGG